MTSQLELVWVKPGETQPNPRNWRRHPEEQLAALDSLIFGTQGVGWAGVALINLRNVEDGWAEEDAVPTYVDGHARDILAQEHDREVPALVGRWSPKQEAMILATLDPTAGLVDYDKAALLRLLDQTMTDDEAVMNVLAHAATEAGLYQEWMQGLDSPSVDAQAQELAGEFGDSFGGDELTDHGGGLGDHAANIQVTWPGWAVLISEDDSQRLQAALETYEGEQGMLNYFVSRVLLNGRETFDGQTLIQDGEEE